MILAQTFHPESVLYEADDRHYVLHMWEDNQHFAFYIASFDKTHAYELYEKLCGIVFSYKVSNIIVTVGEHNRVHDPLQDG